MKILAVEDESFVLDVLVMFLQKSGHTVRSASNGRDGLALTETEAFDLVITDLSMPDMDGLALAKAIKARNATLKVVLLTGSRHIHELPPNIDYILEKPLRTETMTEFLQRLSA